MLPLLLRAALSRALERSRESSSCLREKLLQMFHRSGPPSNGSLEPEIDLSGIEDLSQTGRIR